jgi:TPR repeat protein
MQMGQTYRRGRGVPLDLKLAFRYYMIGAISGHCDAMNSLAMRYELGQGTSQNHYAAFQWYARAAERKSIWATLHLGNFPFSHGLSFVPSKHSICHFILFVIMSYIGICYWYCCKRSISFISWCSQSFSHREPCLSQLSQVRSRQIRVRLQKRRFTIKGTTHEGISGNLSFPNLSAYDE